MPYALEAYTGNTCATVATGQDVAPATGTFDAQYGTLVAPSGTSLPQTDLGVEDRTFNMSSRALSIPVWPFKPGVLVV